ncbi:type I restriction enzyme, R subunit [Peptoclostridium litorale DSM 5388]|uniref:type I site-specific deoxyribonuclease n=1 Tax=Peptoclostridium litorale DSM 5388 TaxID=1121324 RepID=A0A069RH95_PEPLI|nr:type I restriction endonuclease [Peptoclostridium litorale]KDR95540.1 putative type-1 restriction enzyme MjaXP R protein [Peptoclostridium litorale DSM 5388]SIN97827.1 type I restriction enzyme, R subunit [Peptoclostridium litorale DSM 5388]
MKRGESEYALALEIMDRCGYEYRLGKELTPELGERAAMDDFILQKRLISSLERLNPWMSDKDIETAVKKVKFPGRKEGDILISVNENLYEILTRDILKLESVGENGKKEYKRVRFIDFEDCFNNEFLITKGFEVLNENGRTELDIVAFVNGIPLVICERRQQSKNMVFDEELLKKDIISNLVKKSYESGISGSCMINIIYTESKGYMGSLTDHVHQYRGFGEWISKDWQIEPFVRENLLALIKNGIWFENSQDTGERIKSITSLSTILGARRLVQSFENGLSGHFNMFYGTDSDRAVESFTKHILESSKSEGYKIAFITKRPSVKKSVERMVSASKKHIRIFKRIADFLFEKADMEGMGMIFADEDMLGRLIDFCTAGFENEEFEKIIFAVDGFEHRGDDIEKLKKILPGCIFFEFKWNHKLLEHEKKYAYQKGLCKDPDIAIREGHIVKAIVKNKKTGFDTEDSKHKNIEKKAIDILARYVDSTHRQGFKGVLLCRDEYDAKLYYEMLMENIDSVGGENIKMELYLKADLGDETGRLLKAFKDPLHKENTAIMITDHIPDSSFEMPHVKAVYCDCHAKSLQEAIRAVSIGCINVQNKGFSVFVDYAGVNLDYFIEEETIGENADLRGFVLSNENAKRRLEELRGAIKELIENENVIERVVRIMGNKHKRAQYEAFYREFSKIMEELMSESHVAKHLDDFKWFSHIQAVLTAAYAPEKGFDMHYMGKRGKRFLNEYFSEIGIQNIIVPISAFDGDFGRKISCIGSSSARAHAIENAIRRAIEVNLDKNPEFYENLLSKLETILIDTQDDFFKREESLKGLWEEEIEEDIVKARKLGISIDAYRVMHIIDEYAMEDVKSNELLDMAVEISEEIMGIVESNFVKGWNIKKEKLKAVEADVLNMIIREYADVFKLEDVKNVSKELLHFAVCSYETLEFKKRAKEVTVDDFMREILE